MSVFVGLDCGGSTSRVMAVDQSGTILFQGQGGAANLISTPEPKLKRNLQHAAMGCPEPSFVCGCFAGLISEEVRERGLFHMRELFPTAKLRAEPDYTAAFYASPVHTDICVVAGTGSLVCSRGQNGMNKSGGRGFILGDFGSGYQYGRAALIQFLDHPEDRSEHLQSAVLDVFGTLDESSIVSLVYRSATPPTVLGKFAKALGQDAKAGKSYAVECLTNQSDALAKTLSEHAEKFFPGQVRVTVSLAGGLWKSASVYLEFFTEAVERIMSTRTVELSRIQRPPLYGAVELAKELGRGVGVVGN